MGDNFGPEFRASIQPVSDASYPACNMPLSPEARGKPVSQVYPRYLYKNEDRVPVRPECDNVVRFLMNAGYRAVVPGRDDFLYTSAWLQGIAVGLRVASNETDKAAQAAIHNHDHMLEMLAANLRVTWARERDAPEIPRGASGLFFEPDVFKNETTCTGGTGSTTWAMSWVNWMNLALDKGRQLEDEGVEKFIPTSPRTKPGSRSCSHSSRSPAEFPAMLRRRRRGRFTKVAN